MERTESSSGAAKTCPGGETRCVLASQHCKQQGCQQYNDTIVISARTASWSVQLDLIRANLPVEGDAVTD